MPPGVDDLAAIQRLPPGQRVRVDQNDGERASNANVSGVDQQMFDVFSVQAQHAEQSRCAEPSVKPSRVLHLGGHGGMSEVVGTSGER
jgi:hypothetical protein